MINEVYDGFGYYQPQLEQIILEMKYVIVLLAVFAVIETGTGVMGAQLQDGEYSESSFNGVTQAVTKHIPKMELSFAREPRLLADEEEEQDRSALQNEAAFSRLRGGLAEAEERQNRRQRFGKNLKPEQELINKLNGQSAAHIQSDQHGPAIDQQELLKQAGLIEQEVITQETDPKLPKKTYSDLQIALYLAIAIVLSICLIKFIKQRCLSSQASIPTPHEETESLSNM